MVKRKLSTINLSDDDIERIAEKVYAKMYINKTSEYPLTLEQKAKQLGFTKSYFYHIYPTMDLEYKKFGERKIMFK